MSDDPESPAPSTEDRLPVTDPHRIPVVFVNQVVGAGHLNGVINVTLATAMFTPTKNGIEPDLVITSRLRMDMFCAEQLYAQLGSIIAKNTKSETVN
jgi:ATP sulfurylase